MFPINIFIVCLTTPFGYLVSLKLQRLRWNFRFNILRHATIFALIIRMREDFVCLLET